MFYSYNYFRQYNNNEEIKDHKTFYKKFSNEREFGGEFTHLDHLVKTRFANMINGILVLNVWNDTWMIKNCLRLSRALGRIKGDRLPEDFMGCHFNPKDVKSMTVEAGGAIVERIQIAQLFGVLECAQYINRKKYQRVFGKESFQIRSLILLRPWRGNFRLNWMQSA